MSENEDKLSVDEFKKIDDELTEFLNNRTGPRNFYLSPLQFGICDYVPSADTFVASHTKIEDAYDAVIGRMRVILTAKVLAEELVHETVTFKRPKGFFDYILDRLGFGKATYITETYTFDRYAKYPEAPNMGDVFRPVYYETLDCRTGETKE